MITTMRKKSICGVYRTVTVLPRSDGQDEVMTPGTWPAKCPV
eukprot:COSAG02_NODE_62301_length_266_cov_0.622754_1_plen_41_part_10